MKCPVDGETLVMTNRNSVEIDYCPNCRGIWLDRGELDKIIDREQSANAGAGAGDRPQRSSGVPPQSRSQSHEERPRRKREGFLSELFDF